MKKIFITGSIKAFEEFVNREDIEVITVHVSTCEQSASFQEHFIGLVYYKITNP